MEAPFCKVCQHKHRGVAHIWDDEPEPEAPRPKLVMPTRPTVAPRPEMPLAASRPSRGTFDRNAYQRDYMRRRRAAAKAAEQ
jgi:hypothetical protein